MSSKEILNIHECRGCDAYVWVDTTTGSIERFEGTKFVKIDNHGWKRLTRIDGPNAVCPTCSHDPELFIILAEDGYPHVTVTKW